jgi:TatD DNase family protein
MGQAMGGGRQVTGERETPQQDAAQQEARRARRYERAAARAARDEPPPRPEPLAVPVLDSHTHLDLIDPDPVPQIEAARAVGVDRLVQVGVDLESSRWGVAVAGEHDAVVATVAVHPNEAPRLDDLDAALRQIDDLAGHPRVRGLGETGLDYFRTEPDGRKVQEESFRAHIAIAKRWGKPLMIHDRDAHTDVLRVLDSEGAPDTVVLHCFSGDAGFAAECVRRGYVLSFAGTVTFSNAAPLRAAARVCPPDQMLVETDAPFLTPMPFRGRPNGPYLIPLTVRSLAETTGTDLDTLCAAISATGERVFGPWRDQA